MSSIKLQQEGRIELAIAALRNGEITEIRKAARVFNISRRTLLRRYTGTPPQHVTPAGTRKLTEQEEQALIKWIIDLETRGIPPKVGDLRRMANVLLAERTKGDAGISPTVGVNWASNFIKRRVELSSRYLRKHDYQRAQCEDPKLIQAWFQLLHNTRAKYGIEDSDIWNFDETGFQMGIISTAKVVIGSERRGKNFRLQPGNREWVTVIETIGAAGAKLDPLIIFAGKVCQTKWFAELRRNDYHNWRLAVSSNGWTNNELGLWWLQQIFEPGTQAMTKGVYRLLVLDGHSSHNTPEFDKYCKDHKIIPLYMPPHASHLVQPLDVACYSPLKKAYGKGVEKLMALGVHHIDKLEFIKLYGEARHTAMRNDNILSAFSATGIVPVNPLAVLDKLNPIITTPPSTPSPPSSQDPEHNWEPHTPQTVLQIHKQTKTIRKSLKRKTIQSPSPTHQAIIQMGKTAAEAMYQLKAAQEQIGELQEQVNRQIKRKRIKNQYVRGAGLLQSDDVELEVREEEIVMDEDTIVVIKPGTKRRCGRCGEYGHNSRTCLSQSSI